MSKRRRWLCPLCAARADSCEGVRLHACVCHPGLFTTDRRYQCVCGYQTLLWEQMAKHWKDLSGDERAGHKMLYLFGVVK